MKLNKMILPLVLVLAAIVATAGCKKGTPKTTKLPGMTAPQVGDTGLGDTKPFIPDGGTGSTTTFGTPIDKNGHIPMTGDWDPGSMNQNRAALAANTVHFQFDSAVVQDKEQVNLANVAQALASDPNAKLLIEGHCDERGTEEYNRALGERRADALREALAKNGVDAGRIRTISFGKDKPVDPGHSESAFAKNRRGEFVLCTPK